ncbi:ftsX-like permease family protein [Chlamydia ibidis 10-1398/6]|uniref:FtsX-like permease family protein n=1 Tax=Chlamydia ibidis 10-1398/6 TaxID=1046581 RepID=A0ABP2XEF4_9CHLA|nr:ftsX-like permease family protein [Chlamydia ibidis 10-1398/6]
MFSVCIVSLVVWLSIVFISVIHGLEQRWIRDLAQLHSPVKVVPSDEYYSSYYYQIDRHADSSHYSLKTIGEKLVSSVVDPYDPEVDYSLPDNFPIPDRDQSGMLRDPVKVAVHALNPLFEQKQIEMLEFEEGFGYIKMDRVVSARKAEPRSLSQFIAYTSDVIYENRVLPYEKTDYSSDILNPFNASKEGWKQDFTYLQNHYRGASVILPMVYRDQGYRVGDSGSISIFSPERQEEVKYPIYVIGFYNPGLSPLGGKTIFIDMDLASIIRAESSGLGMNNGFHVLFSDTKQITKIKQQIDSALDALNIHKYWEVSSLYDSESFRPILDQLRSDQVLFLLISGIILCVACSNIVTMSVLLVNNKKKEIGILKAMGASSTSLKIIFGLCGAVSGALGVVIGSLFAVITLKNLPVIIKTLNYLQGREAFHASFFGQTLPQDLHIPTLITLGIGTLALSAISGMLPARQVSKMHVSQILKSE